MPLSKRCSICGLPFKGHSKRASRMRPIQIVTRVKKIGNKRPPERPRESCQDLVDAGDP
jgi:hypothetical protein